MKRTIKTKKRVSDRSLILASIVALFLLIVSFYFVNQSSLQLSKASQPANCEGASYSKSADGLIVIEEADLRCVGGTEAKHEYEKTNTISKVMAAVSTIFNFIFLTLLLKRSFKK